MFAVNNTVVGEILKCEWIGEGWGHLFDVSSTLLGAILNWEWSGDGVRDTCLMLAALCWVRYRTVCGLEREGGDTCLLLAALC